MNRSSKGFGLTGVFITVLVLVITAVMSSSAKSAELQSPISITQAK
ncbi:hypothetical protein [Aliiglaciecola litoralis]|uniref:Uncharacterized protein n=1 Tax=Aliiglaciecola litoralis TaxID=582857 RepID=A0ABN1LKH5_9ALTE